MPLLEIFTNTVVDNEQIIATNASKLATEILNKPESYVMVRIQTEQTLLFAGSNEPAALVQLKSLDLPEKNTPEFSSRICNFISSEFNINSARIYIEFSNPERHMWGWDKRTF